MLQPVYILLNSLLHKIRKNLSDTKFITSVMFDIAVEDVSIYWYILFYCFRILKIFLNLQDNQ